MSDPIFLPGTRAYWLWRLDKAVRAVAARKELAEHKNHVHFAVGGVVAPTSPLRTTASIRVREAELAVAAAQHELQRAVSRLESAKREQARFDVIMPVQQIELTVPSAQMEQIRAWLDENTGPTLIP